MKRKSKFKSENKYKRICESQEFSRSRESPSPRGMPPPEPEPIETDPDNDHGTMDNENSTEITIPTYNRFEILRIPIPKPTVYKAQKPQSKPPAIIIREPLSKVKPLLPNEHYGVQNNNNGFRLLCNDIDQHKRFMELLTMKRVQLYTHPYASDKTIRYVLYGLNTYTIEELSAELLRYGLQPKAIKKMTVKTPRYDDHATYLVYFSIDSGVTLSVIKQARVIMNTIVKWAHYKPNGDGITVCSHCSGLGHSASFCNLSPKCGVCSGAHTTANCEHILNKRAYNREKIAVELLRCPNCGGKHTRGYKKCEGRIEYINRRQRNRTTYTPAPLPPPESIPWNFPELRGSKKQTNRIPPTGNHNQYNSDDSTKFSPPEVFKIFNKILNCIENCNTKTEQMQVMLDIMQEFFK